MQYPNIIEALSIQQLITKGIIMNIFELCVYGDLFFFENSFSKTELSLIKIHAKKYFLTRAENLNINDFIQHMRKETNITLVYCPITAVVAV